MGTKADLAERDQRFKKTREAMEREGLKALLVAGKGHWWTGRGYLRYFTDFHLWAHDGLLLIPLTGEPVMTFTSHAVAKMIAKRGWVSDARGDVYLAPNMIGAMKEKGLTEGNVGIAGLTWIMPAGTYQQLQEALPSVKFVNADDLMDRIRMVKSPLEIQQIRELYTLSKSAMERFVEVVEPGKTERELAAEACKVAIAGGVRDILVLIDGNIPRDVPVQCNDILKYHMEFCGESGHCLEITVNCAYREPTELELKLMESELRAYEAIRQIAKPGVKLTDLARTFERVLLDDGWEFGEPRTGFDFHGQGLDWVERPWWAEAQPWGQYEDWQLEEGTVLNYHPRRATKPKVLDTGINENILITSNGAERLGGDWDLRWRMMDR